MGLFHRVPRLFTGMSLCLVLVLFNVIAPVAAQEMAASSEPGHSASEPASSAATVIFCDVSIIPTPTPITVIPEPGTFVLLLLGGAIAWRLVRRRRASARTTLVFLGVSLSLLLSGQLHDLIAQTGCTLTVARQGAGRGRVTGEEIDCGESCRLTRGSGEVLHLTAWPDDGDYVFGWLVNGERYTGPYQMHGDTTLTAIFEHESPPIPPATPTPTGPVADFLASPVRGAAPLTVTLTNTSLGAISQATWDFGDGQTSHEPHPTHVYAEPARYTISLSVAGPDGADLLTRTEYVEVLAAKHAPVITISSPAEDEVAAAGELLIRGRVAAGGAVVSVRVNEVLAAFDGEVFSASLALDNGAHVITVVAEDDAGAIGAVSRLVQVDGEGPLIGITSPRRGQAVSTLQPFIAVTYSDVATAVDLATLQVHLTDARGVTTDVTGDLTLAPDQASGTLRAPLTGDMRYTLRVALADTLGNVAHSEAAFYVPLDPASITPPVEPEDAGWVCGVVYDSTTCNEHLRGCTPLPGASVTLTLAGEDGDPLPGTIVTGPDGFFAFPVGATAAYWLRVEKAGYTYAQREVEVVRRHSTGTDELYLTPLDPALTLCDESGCAHTSSDGLLQVEIPPGAIAAGAVVEVTATNFRHVEFLPSGSLPPGTWETYAFNLGGDSDVAFLTPITVKIRNYRGFAPGEEIPLGYWNPKTQAWEHEGFGLVDASGEWVVMSLTHFSNYDCNYTVLVPPNSDPPPPPTNQTAPATDPGVCADGSQNCFIDFKSGTFKEDYALPAVKVLGQDVAPRLLYNSRRAHPNALIDLEFTVEPQEGLLDYAEFEVYIEGKKTEKLVISSPTGVKQRYRYLWDGRDAQGRRMGPGVYRYSVRLRVPYRAQYYRAYSFGGELNPAYPTGVYVDATHDYWTSGAILLDADPANSLGSGWSLDGQQRLLEDDAGRILISDGTRNDEFYHPYKNLLLRREEPGDSIGEAAVIPVEYEATGYVVQMLSQRDLRFYSHANGWDHRQYLYLAENQYIVPAPYCVYTASGLAKLYADNPGVYPEFSMTDWFNVIGDAGSSSMSRRQWACYYPNPANIEGIMYLGSIGYAPTSNPAYLYSYTIANEYLTNRQVITFTALTPNSVEPNVYKLTIHSSAPVTVTLSENLDNPAEVHLIGPGEEVTLQRTGDVHNPGYRWFVDLRGLSSSDMKPTSQTKDDPSRLEFDPETATYTRYYPNGTQVHFNSDGTHDSTLDRHGNRTTYTYNQDGTTATMSITPSGESAPRWTWTFSYQNGVLSSITDPAGRVTQFAIDGNKHLTHITAPDGATRRFAYDSRGLMTHEADENGNITEHLYDTYGRITQVREPAGGGTQRVLTFTPSDTSYPLLNDSPIGDPDSPAPAVPTSGDLAAGVRYGRGGLRGLTDKWGRWLHKTDGLGRATAYQRDGTGKLLKRTYQDGTCDTYSYDKTGNVLQTSRKEASLCAETSAPLTSFATLMEQGIVQGFSNHSSESLPLETLATDQDDQRQQESLSLRASNAFLSEQEMVTRFTYEERFNRLKTKTDPAGNVTTYVYDYEEGVGEAGNLIRIISPAVADERGVLATPTISYSYNALGLVETATDARGVVTRYIYTQGTPEEAETLFAPGLPPVPGLLTQVIEDAGGLNQTTTYSQFDAAGNPGTVTGPGCCGNGQVTHYTYDILGRVQTKTDALGLVATYAYDPAGNLIRRTDTDPTGRAVTTRYTYDAGRNLISQRIEADGIVSETSRAYDLNGKLASQTDANGKTTAYTYDDADQLVSVADPQHRTSYSYTSKGQLEATTLPTGAVMKTVYNAFGRKAQAIADEQGLALTTAYTYDRNGSLKTLTDANLAVTTMTYDALNRLTVVTDALAQTTRARYDLAGNLRFLTDAKGQTTEFVYDALTRLTQDIRPMGQTTSYAYDAAGNLAAKVDANGQRTEYDYDPAPII